MGIKERKKREKQQRREDIINAAEKVFFSKGLNDATMDEIAAAAELSKGTLYLYFNSKEDLYLAVVTRAQKILIQLFEEHLEGEASGLEKVRAVGRAYFRFFREYPHYFEALLYFEKNYEFDPQDENSYAQSCQEANDQIMALVCGAVERGIEDGSIRSELDPMETTILLWAKSVGIIQIISLKSQVLEELYQVKAENLIESFFDFIDYALKPRKL